MATDTRSAVPKNVRAGRDVSGFPDHCIFQLVILRLLVDVSLFRRNVRIGTQV